MPSIIQQLRESRRLLFYFIFAQVGTFIYEANKSSMYSSSIILWNLIYGVNSQLFFWNCKFH